MTYSIIGILATILLLIGNRDVLRKQRESEYSRTRLYYRRFLLGVLVYYITDMLWGLLDEQRLTSLQFIDTTVYFVAMIATVVLWARYVVSYLNRKNFFEKWLLRTGQAIFGVFLIFIVINFFYPVFFWFDDQGVYHTAFMRHAALLVQIAMFLSTSIYTFYMTAKTQGDIRQRHLTIGLFGLAMVVMIAFQVFFPLWPFYAMGCMIGITLLHSFVLEDETEEYRRELERSREALKEALAAAEKASKAKTVFLSNMSHEIRTPLNAIIGLNSIAMNDADLSQTTREHLQKIGTSAQHLLGVINDILDISRIESGSMSLKNAEFSFVQELEQVNAIVTAQCHDKKIRYSCDVKDGVSNCYIGDEMKLRQVLINILGNAVKFTPEGGSVSLVVEALAVDGEKCPLRFTVVDSGIGIGKDFMPRMFEAFALEDESYTSKHGSTGLGLSITKSIVELMDGRIDVESEKGVGSKFTVTVTLQKSPHNGGGLCSSGGQREKPRATLSGRKVLLAEDLPVNAEIMAMVLSMREMKAERAENGRIAVEMFKSHEPGYYSAILMDVRMPEMDGLEATRVIRSMDREDAKSIPIIALTANAFDEDVQNSLQAGLNAHLSKPVEPDVLFKTLEELL
ncbi:ATP-binding protein [Fibrobacter sp. UWB5]|uniref:hybrid sensor histidine kinase/response regulator n=1 Tax=Fibrobacter sp. UWB5 TaxID=1964360 RepID=UPI001303D538|nr:ATP-binding protein [Fibrobacter sp. UWB5]